MHESEQLCTGFVETNGTTLYYEMMGEDHAPKQELVPPAFERLNEIHVPTLIIVGAEDHFRLHKSADKLEQDITGARRVIISETHHMPNMEKPEEFNRIVYDFLKSLKRGNY
jgi:2-hydroxy-6-oxonona-2,4-dienedioate hydrolase